MNLIIHLSKYLVVFLMILYTLYSFLVFTYSDYRRQDSAYRGQTVLTFMIHLVCFAVLYAAEPRREMLIFYALQVIFLIAALILYTTLYPRIARVILNHMLMLLVLGLIMITRLNFEKGVRQFVFMVVGLVVSLIVPIIIRKVKRLADLRILYGIGGVVALLAVLIRGATSNGAKLGFNIGPVNIQPSEFVKLLLVFFVAASLYKKNDFKTVCITTAIVAAQVLILVVSRDLGAALIIFVVYLVMLYAATGKAGYPLLGLCAGAVASIGAYAVFDHVKDRVIAWKDPLGSYDEQGYQVSQALFAIGTGGWFGMGLGQGMPDTIPVPTSDFIFAAICEEMGIFFALCLILICLSCYIMFVNVAMKFRSVFYKLVALGLGTCYITQTFLNIGGVIKFIPSTGVTLPLVSYGGSSLISTMIMFAIVQGLYILREDEERDIERKRKKAEQIRQRS